GAGGGGDGGIVNAPAQTPNPVSMKMYAVSPGLSPGQTGPSPPPPAQPPPPASPDPVQPPGPSPGVNSPTGPVGQNPGAQINPAQPAPPQTEFDVLASIPGASDEPTPPLYEGYWWEVLK